MSAVSLQRLRDSNQILDAPITARRPQVGRAGSHYDIKAGGVVDAESGWGSLGFALGAGKGILVAIGDWISEAWETIKGVYNFAVAIVRGELSDLVTQLYEAISNLSVDQILDGCREWVSEKFGDFRSQWNAESTYDRWFFRGQVIFYGLCAGLLALVTSLVTGGAGALGKFGRLFEVLGLDEVVERVRRRMRRSRSLNIETRTLGEGSVARLNRTTAGSGPESHRSWNRNDRSYTDFRDGDAQSFYFDEDALRAMAERQYRGSREYAELRAQGYELADLRIETRPRSLSGDGARYGGRSNVTPEVTAIEVDLVPVGGD